jgi:mersacidin/lichenicidin family type 2 lantibiotic
VGQCYRAEAALSDWVDEYLYIERSSKLSTEDIINAWRDEEYRESLDDEQRAVLPESPIGPIDLSEAELEDVEGGSSALTPILSAATIAFSIKLCVSIGEGGTCTVDGRGC